MKPLLPSVCLGLLVATCCGASAQGLTDTNFFPIMAWNWTPKDPAVLQKMKDCGLTVAGFVSPETLDACQAAGLKAIVSDTRTSGYDWGNVDEAKARQNVASLVGEVGQHPALYGYYLRDEPNAALFPGLAKVAKLIRELSPGKWPYINLFPDYADAGQLGTSDYAEHLERFIAVCGPAIISYDNYSLMDDGSLRANYWSNLEAVRAASRKHGLVFWNIVLSSAHFNYREVGAADFRFQAYTTLAYGGRGLSYFTYFTPSHGNYRMGPIDQFGNQTPTWYFMQHVNLQIQKLAPTLLHLTSDAVYHFGSVPSGTSGPPTNSLVTGVGGDNFMAGDFTHRDGTRYLMIVNKDLSKSRVCSPSFRQAPRRVQHVSAYTGGLTSFEGEDVWLAPGAGVLLKVEQ
ncbi:MAG TPA: hypothetical protein P5205_03875 [Candidatus Paceibacterota bacterium]|nr:hypothetical protein [Verrucomicrobiota bacterium]HSA09488.1 hypothetical protein [Candidatus Paceibacterota bacterium]